MRDQALFDKIDLHLIRVLHTVLTERSVSKAAIRLGMYQPAVSASLKKLRALAGDPLLVRSGAGMVPTDAGLRMLAPSASILRAAESMFSDARSFDPSQRAPDLSHRRQRLSSTRCSCRGWWRRSSSRRPTAVIEILPLSAESDYRTRLAQGEMDVVIGNWLQPPDDLHLGRLFGDEVVCLVARDHPAVRRSQPGRLGRGELAGGRAHRAHAHAPGRARRDRRTPGFAGPAAQHHRALPPFRADSEHGGIKLARADHGPPVLRALSSTGCR
jgi:DNA-binding transcriptional LysR family regulator